LDLSLYIHSHLHSPTRILLIVEYSLFFSRTTDSQVAKNHYCAIHSQRRWLYRVLSPMGCPHARCSLTMPSAIPKSIGRPRSSLSLLSRARAAVHHFQKHSSATSRFQIWIRAFSSSLNKRYTYDFAMACPPTSPDRPVSSPAILTVTGIQPKKRMKPKAHSQSCHLVTIQSEIGKSSQRLTSHAPASQAYPPNAPYH
jgi:hypothetical protein